MPPWLAVATAGLAIAHVSPRLWSWLRQRRQHRKRQGEPLRRVVARCEAKWFLEELQLAMQGSAEAMVKVGHMLMSGYGIRQDPSEAAKWLRQAWAIQNFKEPAMAEMMDVEESPVPKVNSRFEAQQRRRPAAKASSSALSSSCEPSDNLPQLDIATAYKLVAMAQSQLQQEMAQQPGALPQEQQAAGDAVAQAGTAARIAQHSRLAQPRVAQASVT